MTEPQKDVDLTLLGATWNRRRFLAGLFSAGTAAACAITVAQDGGLQPLEEEVHSTLNTNSPPPAASLSPLEECKEGCYDMYLYCCQGCKRLRSRVKRALCYSACFTPYVACLTGCEAEWALSVAGEAVDWIAAHPEVVVGTIVVVAGVTMIVATGGSGALVLVPLV